MAVIAQGISGCYNGDNDDDGDDDDDDDDCDAESSHQTPLNTHGRRSVQKQPRVDDYCWSLL